MNQHSLSGTFASTARTHHQEVTGQRTEWGRKAILSGCIITMAGMVTYCYGTLGGAPEADLFEALFNNGVLGWGSLLFMVMGVGIWVAGSVALLGEADRAEAKR